MSYKNHRRNSFEISLRLIIYGSIILIALFTLGFNLYAQMHKFNVTAVVTDKDIKRYEDRDKYLVFTNTKDGKPATFEITDSIYPFRYNSSDLYGAIEVGGTYDFEVRGYRIPILSMYPNIYKASKLEE